MLVLLALLAVVVVASAGSEFYVFNDVTPGAVADLLTPLLLVALFLERAQEVLVTAWRGIGGREIEERIRSGETQLAAGPADMKLQAAQTVDAARADLTRYKGDTQRLAFLIGLIAGVLTSAVGIRVLQPLVSWDLEIVGWQKFLFHFVDIAVTGALLAGGSDGLHKLVSIFTDFFDQTRARIAEAPGAHK